jgi:hypothetical protein
MDRKQLGRYGCSGSTFTDTNQIAIIVTTGLFMSVGLTFAASIISIGLQFFYAAILRILEQSVAIAITLHIFRAHSQTRYEGKARLPQPLSASSYFRKWVMRPCPASLTAAGQSSVCSVFASVLRTTLGTLGATESKDSEIGVRYFWLPHQQYRIVRGIIRSGWITELTPNWWTHRECCQKPALHLGVAVWVLRGWGRFKRAL